MKQRWAWLLSAGVAMAISHAALAADAPLTPASSSATPSATPAPATNNPGASRPAPASPQDNAKSHNSNQGEAKRACTSRMYGALPRGRGAPNRAIYEQCMRQHGAA